MQTSEIILHIMKWLPRYSDKFSDYITPSAVSITDGVVTVSASGNTKKTGEYICVTHARVKNIVDSFSYADSVMTITTTDAHDFTEGWQATATIKSTIDDSINGDYQLLTVPARNIITVSGIETLPADAYISEVRDYTINGLYKIYDSTAAGYKFDMSFTDCDVPDGFTQSIDAETVRIHNSIRVSGAVTIERFLKSYEKTSDDKLWAVVVRNRNQISKQSSSRTDAPIEQTGFSAWSCNTSNPFTVNIVCPCYTVSGMRELDSVEAQRPSLYRTLLGQRFSTGFSSTAMSTVAPDDDGQVTYDETKVIVPFNFYQLVELGNDDVSFTQNTSAMSGLSIDFLNNNDDNNSVIMSLSMTFEDNGE